MTRDPDTRTQVKVRWGRSAPKKAAVLGTLQHKITMSICFSSLTYVNRRPRQQQVKCWLSDPLIGQTGTE